MLAVVASVDAQAPPAQRLGARPLAIWFHLVSILAAAAATVSVCFGIGFPLLLQEAQGARQHGLVIAGDTLSAKPSAHGDVPAASLVSRSAPAAAVAAAFVRLPPPISASMTADKERPSLPEHAATGTAAASTATSRPAVPLKVQKPTPASSEAIATNVSAASSPQPPPSKQASESASARSAAPLPAAEVAALLDRGDQFLRAGDVASARLFYERAANSGDGQAALREAATFDPAFLANAGLRGTLGDPAKAHWWYVRAHQPEPAQAAR
jgi:hypothetical protein